MCIFVEFCKFWKVGVFLRECLLKAAFTFLLFIASAQLAFATVSITTNNSAANLATAIAAGNAGITLTGTPVLTVGLRCHSTKQHLLGYVATPLHNICSCVEAVPETNLGEEIFTPPSRYCWR
jgi:hypothetical protein